MKKFLAAILATAAFAGTANAANLLSNGSFESGTNPGGFTTVAGGNSTAVTDWVVGGHSIDYIGSYWTAQDGNRSIDLAGNGIGSIAQGFATQIGQAYSVSYWIGRNPDGGTDKRTGFIDVGGTQTLFTFDGVNSNKANMKWERETFTFTANSAFTTLRFSADPATSNNFFGAALDNVSVSAVPEPATWAMMIAGIGLVGATMRRRRTSLQFA